MQYRALRPVHVLVPGRARFAVAGLRDDPRLARELERICSVDPDIRAVAANHLTGKILVLYSRSIAHVAIAARLEVLLGQDVPAGPEGRAPNRSHPIDRPGSSEDAWHALKPEEIADRFASHLCGGMTEVAARGALQHYGANELAKTPPRQGLAILFDQVRTLPVGLLIGSAVFSALTGGLLDAAAIAAVVAINAAIGFVTESQAERTIGGLEGRTNGEAQVVRDGTVQHRPVADVVPGDVLALMPGALVPADARIVASEELSVDESVLTGESLPARKTHEDMLPPDTPLPQRSTMVYRGTAVTGGKGQAVVVATGARTEIGKIQSLVGATRPPATPLQRQLDRTGRRLGYVSLALCGGMLGLGLLRGYGMTQMLKSSISLAIAALPEGLPTVATTTLALGIRDMRRHKVLVRRLNAVETLGSVHTLCFDKTGTLTLNHMRVVEVFAGERQYRFPDSQVADDPVFQHIIRACVLCSDVRIERPAGDRDYELRGSATEIALVQLALEHGTEPEVLRAGHPLVDVVYRSERRKYMMTRHRSPDGSELLVVKGSPEEVLALSGQALVGADALLLDDDRRKALAAENERMGKTGLRVLAFAMSGSGGDPAQLTWLGLVGLADPVRPEMAGLMQSFRKAGLRTVMITGDQAATAYTVARTIDLSGKDSVEILEGTALEKMDPPVLSALALKTDVFARVTPSNKLQIVQALQGAREIVAMTGDGVNDSPALRAADIGVAMGSGSEAAHEVADIILQDDELATMLLAIAKGRGVYANIRKSVHFLLSTNFSEIMVMMGGTAFSLGQPLSPAQLLWINMVTDIFPGLALGLDPPEKDILRAPPRDPNKAIVDREDFVRISTEGSLITVATLASHLVGRARLGGAGGAGGFGFTTLTVAQLLHSLSCRSRTSSVFRPAGAQPNPYLRWALAGLFGLQLLATSLPVTRRVLGLGGMRLADTMVAAVLGAAPFVAIEGAKLVRPNNLVRKARRKRP